MDPEQEVLELQKQLSQVYLGIAAKYKRMSKINDAYRWDGVAAGIAYDLKNATEIRLNIDALNKEILAKWNDRARELPPDYQGWR